MNVLAAIEVFSDVPEAVIEYSIDPYVAGMRGLGVPYCPSDWFQPLSNARRRACSRATMRLRKAILFVRGETATDSVEPIPRVEVRFQGEPQSFLFCQPRRDWQGFGSLPGCAMAVVVCLEPLRRPQMPIRTSKFAVGRRGLGKEQNPCTKSQDRTSRGREVSHGPAVPRTEALPGRLLRLGRAGDEVCYHAVSRHECEPTNTIASDYQSGRPETVAEALPESPQYAADGIGRDLSITCRLRVDRQLRTDRAETLLAGDRRALRASD